MLLVGGRQYVCQGQKRLCVIQAAAGGSEPPSDNSSREEVKEASSSLADACKAADGARVHKAAAGSGKQASPQISRVTF